MNTGYRFISLLAVCAFFSVQGGIAVGQAGNETKTADSIREDMSAQKRISELEKEIEKTWQVVQEIRERAQQFRLTYARFKDALRNPGCTDAIESLRSLGKSLQGNARLSVSLQSQCSNLNADTQKELSLACQSEMRTLAEEEEILRKQEQELLGKCPGLKSTIPAGTDK